MTKPDRQSYKIAGPATWELIRAAYLAGESAPALAERFGVSAHAIRKRITKEKWTKRDYAAALEARGLTPPRPAPLNIAERFAANHVPPEASPAPEHPFAELVAALKEASAALETARARTASEAPAESAAQLERRALAQVGAALDRGRAVEAKTLAGVAEQMRRCAEREEAPAPAGQEPLDDAAREALAVELFARVAELASAMLHNPAGAPATLIGMIKAWREINLGEGAADAEERAARQAEALRRHLDGAWEENLPAHVREHLAQRWEALRTQA